VPVGAATGLGGLNQQYRVKRTQVAVGSTIGKPLPN